MLTKLLSQLSNFHPVENSLPLAELTNKFSFGGQTLIRLMVKIFDPFFRSLFLLSEVPPAPEYDAKSLRQRRAKAVPPTRRSFVNVPRPSSKVSSQLPPRPLEVSHL